MIKMGDTITTTGILQLVNMPALRVINGLRRLLVVAGAGGQTMRKKRKDKR